MTNNLEQKSTEKGASAVEFALVLPVLLLILFGIIEFGLLVYNKQVLTNASREGARAGIVSTSGARVPCDGNPSISTIVDDYCGDHLVTFSGVTTDPSITCQHNGTNFTGSPPASFKDDLKVTVSYHYDFLLLPSFMNSLAGGLDLKAETVMKYE